MKAAVQRKFGSPDAITVEEVVTPAPAHDEVLVRVRACTVGVVDSLARPGSPAYARPYFGLRRPRFAVLGCDFAARWRGPRGSAARRRPSRFFMMRVSLCRSQQSAEPAKVGP